MCIIYIYPLKIFFTKKKKKMKHTWYGYIIHCMQLHLKFELILTYNKAAIDN
jgi:hypothetical protein